MTDEGLEPAMAVLSAVCAAVVPGFSTDATPGASEIGAQGFVAHHLGGRLQAFSDAVLEAEPEFVSLEPLAQTEAVRRMLDRVEGMRAVVGLTVGAVYGSWSGTDDEAKLVRAPLGWELASYDGPVLGRRPLGT